MIKKLLIKLGGPVRLNLKYKKLKRRIVFLFFYTVAPKLWVIYRHTRDIFDYLARRHRLKRGVWLGFGGFRLGQATLTHHGPDRPSMSFPTDTANIGEEIHYQAEALLNATETIKFLRMARLSLPTTLRTVLHWTRGVLSYTLTPKWH